MKGEKTTVWVKSSGLNIEVNDDEVTAKHCKSLGWKKAEESVEVPEDDNPEKVPE
ncbi:MAG: hypothetical protein O7D95_06245 [Betaproteobacteria bacterium]|nr:hypothetical protein [Betaproteobacteria bacterium]